VGPENTSSASAMSRPRFSSVAWRFAESKVIFTDNRYYEKERGANFASSAASVDAVADRVRRDAVSDRVYRGARNCLASIAAAAVDQVLQRRAALEGLDLPGDGGENRVRR